MKKAGSSSSKSKTRRTSKSTARDLPDPSEFLAVGHKPSTALTPTDEALYRAFQSNLLSLISHELRTPLSSILNSLAFLEEGLEDASKSGDLLAPEMVTVARQNAQRLNRALSALLDLAAIESGTFHARLKEVDLRPLVQSRLESYGAMLKDRQLLLEAITISTERSPILADPQKLGRAVDLVFQILVPRAALGSSVKIRISSSGALAQFGFVLAQDTEAQWDRAWSEAIAGFQGGVASPHSAFGGVLQSEQLFLTRTEEGLGSEFLLVHEIMRLHSGQFMAKREGRGVTLGLELPELSSEEGIRAVLKSRAYVVSSELTSVTLAIIQLKEVPRSELESVRESVKKCLFRSSDVVYLLPKTAQLAIVMDDCRPMDTPAFIQKLSETVQKPFQIGVAHCPSEVSDPSRLFELAEKRLSKV